MRIRVGGAGEAAPERRPVPDDAAGKAKEATGKATDNERLEAEGKTDQAGADMKQSGEKLKDAFKD